MKKITKNQTASLLALAALIGAAGCAATSTPARGALDVECSEIAPGVELAVSANAGPEARRIADDIRAKYVAELITSRSTLTPRWPAR